jgi:hypothetical protein
VANSDIDDVFCLYLWRSIEAPGTLYLASCIDSAKAVCVELIAAGYIVRVVQMVTNVEFELREGALVALDAPYENRNSKTAHTQQSVA